MTNIERFKEILIQIPFDHNDLSLVNQDEYLPLFLELFEIYKYSSPKDRNSIEDICSKRQGFNLQICSLDSTIPRI